ncbi:hypothetical protein CORC01_12209 [Colletotrichum orchidophilum]|uniref:Uncharacterized protein n=1 Tax=Colletotrichum orchidophilum TaxID=1209926 RepID=A0A1G4ATR0_9PEZI|nr:uncharacterized protein CORC01_12209 [Colletotrichum orchidophilum]OHE92491.1 hypothetical protein CORC01_12209 [Colletotrichum orchidophilum]
MAYYIRVLLCAIHILENSQKTAKRREFLAQELSNVLHLKFLKSQGEVKRIVQCFKAEKYFERVPDTYDNLGNEAVVLKDGPIEKRDRKTYYSLQLCKPGLTPRQAASFLTNLAEFYNQPSPGLTTMVPEGIEFSEFSLSTCFANLNLITSFIIDLEKHLNLPPVSYTKGQLYVSRIHQLDAELATVRRRLDLRGIVPDIDKLSEPAVAFAAKDKILEAIEEKLGICIGARYWFLVLSCIDSFPDLGHHAMSRVSFNIGFPVSACTCGLEHLDKPVNKKKKKKKLKKKKKKSAQQPDVQLEEAAALADDPTTTSPSKAGGDSSVDGLGTSKTESLALGYSERDFSTQKGIFSVHRDSDAASSNTITDHIDTKSFVSVNNLLANFPRAPAAVPGHTNVTPTEDNFGESLHRDDQEDEDRDNDKDGDVDEGEVRVDIQEDLLKLDDSVVNDKALELKNNKDRANDTFSATPPGEVIHVSARTATVMATMFDKSLHQGSLTWPEFTAAMVEVGFTADRKKGSAIAFVPSPSEDGSYRWKQSIQFHVTHGSISSQIEGHRSRRMAARLTRAFGWNAKTFQIA